MTEMKPWQHGHEISKLLEIEALFSEYNSLCISPFLEMKKNRVAEHLHNERLVLEDGFRFVLKQVSINSSPIKVYSARSEVLAYKEKGEYEITSLMVENQKAFSDYLQTLKGNVWIISFDYCEKAILDSGFEKIGYKYSSFGDDLAVYFLERDTNDFFSMNESRLVYSDPVERATCVKIDEHNFDVEDLASKVASYDFNTHYSNYNKGGGWSALSLRGFSSDPTFITKPQEMNDKWKEKHKDQDFSLRDTPLYDHFPEIRAIVSAVAPTQEIERVRLMKLEAGKEIGKHTDLVDPDCGVEIGKTARFHVPLITKDAIFEVWGQNGREAYHLNKGALWYLDTRKPHRVTNPHIDRYHLVFDVFVDQEIRDLIKRSLF